MESVGQVCAFDTTRWIPFRIFDVVADSEVPSKERGSRGTAIRLAARWLRYDPTRMPVCIRPIPSDAFWDGLGDTTIGFSSVLHGAGGRLRGFSRPRTPRRSDFVKSWTVSDCEALLSVGLEGYRDHENGRRGFARGRCVKMPPPRRRRTGGKGSRSTRPGNGMIRAVPRHCALAGDRRTGREPRAASGSSRRRGGYLDDLRGGGRARSARLSRCGREAGHPAFAK